MLITRCKCAILAAVVLTTGTASKAQERSLSQDPRFDMLKHPPGYQTVTFASLGAVQVSGSGSRGAIVIPGAGFSASTLQSLAARLGSEFTTYTVTLPGFGGTAALPLPNPQQLGDLAWTRSAEQAILALMDSAGIGKATLVAHWIGATQIATRLALNHPDRFDGVLLVAGVAESFYSSDTTMRSWNTARRVATAEAMGSQWFRTVTPRTWHDQNFMPYDYAVDPLRGMLLWNEAATPALQVWIRYLLEFYAIDGSEDLAKLRVPVLVVQPGFDDPAFYVDGERDYMRDLTQRSWYGIPERNPSISIVTIPNTRLFVWMDNAAAFDAVVQSFLSGIRDR